MTCSLSHFLNNLNEGFDKIKCKYEQNNKKYETCYEDASHKIRDTKIFKRKIKVRSLRAVGWRNKRQF